jgi:hypothetical protein
MLSWEQKRAIDLIKDLKNTLDVNLDGYKVLTELGSKYYLYSPLIPLLCGADFVYAFVKDTRYGKAAELSSQLYELATKLGLQDKLKIGSNILDSTFLQQADIVTNSGMLRPLNKEKLSLLKKGAVVPLMFEAWELREEDIDIEFCKEQGIKVAGTWENHPSIMVFNYVMMLGIKLAHEAGFEVLDNNIFIWSNDHFGEILEVAFTKNGARNCTRNVDYKSLLEVVKDLDFIILADYDELNDFETIFDFNELQKLNPTLGIIHLYGSIKYEQLHNAGFNIYPKKDGFAKLMTYTLAHVGLEPIMKLQVASYRVATEMLRNSYTDLSQPIA